MIKAVVFDMDGLMFDTERLWVEEGYKLAIKLGYSIPKELFYETIGMKNEDASKNFSNNLGYNFPFITFRKLYHKVINLKLRFEKIKEKLGLKELLVYLKNNDYKIAIASSNKKERIYLYLKSANINPDFFDVIVSGDDVLNGKPNPEIFKLTCQKLNEKNSDILVLEDSLNGSLAAINSGCHLIIVPDIVKLPDFLYLLADKVENSLMDIISLLEKNKL